MFYLCEFPFPSIITTINGILICKISPVAIFVCQIYIFLHFRQKTFNTENDGVNTLKIDKEIQCTLWNIVASL